MIITPKPDIASQNIKDQILRMHSFKEKNINGFKVYESLEFDSVYLIDIDEDSIYAENLEDKFNAELFIFVTRHSAASKIPALLTHAPGNWTDKTLFGGKPRRICIAPASTLKVALLELIKASKKYNLDDWKVGLEVTHHGPYVDKIPTMFIELGSSEEQWKNVVAAKAVAQAVINTVKIRIKGLPKFKIGVGFGGPHYAPIFTKLAINSEYAIGHIIPEYVFDEVTENQIKAAIKRNEEKVEVALIEWKGLKKRHRNLLIPALEEIGIKWIRI